MARLLFNRTGIGVCVAEDGADLGLVAVHSRHNTLGDALIAIDSLVGDAIGLGLDRVIIHWQVCGMPDYQFGRLIDVNN